MQYKSFTLDKFQMDAITAIDDYNTVIVCAPTGSGKTLIAEYIIDKCMKENSEVIYTAPLKALSNQKFRDFKNEYGDKVGIITGDVVINANAPCLIMTTEILRNIIYEEPQRLTYVKYVVLDEIHYIEDPRRGTVWEESIMLAPPHIRFLCLSATIANVDELANWIQSIRGHKVSIVLHTIRPVPLEQFVYIEGGSKAFQIKKLNASFAYANAILAKQKQNIGNKENKKYSIPIFEYLKSKELIPILCFSFSRKNCEKKAFQYKYMNLLTEEESNLALKLFDEHVEKFGIKNYLSTQNLRNLIIHGTAYHHAGMLPAQKDIVEVLFSKNLIKLLFATETFAVGINMPAKTVVFDGLEKNDGVSFRYLKSHEFQQMAGRAGRRGIDEKGFVYALIDPKYYNRDEVRKTLLGNIEPLRSHFAFSYSSILNLYSKHTKSEIIELCQKSFGYFQFKSTIQSKLDQINEYENYLKNIDCSKNVNKSIAKHMLLDYVQLLNEVDENKKYYNNLKRLIGKARSDSERLEIRSEINHTQNKILFLKRRLKNNKCSNCKVNSECVKLVDKYLKLKKNIEQYGQYIGFDLEDKFLFLEAIGYIDKEKLLARGQFASQIFGYEIQATELYFEGYIHKLTEDEINALICGIVFENKAPSQYTIHDKNLKKLLREFRYKIEDIINIESQYCKFSSIKPIENAMSEVAYKWSMGAKFEELIFTQNTLLEGDLIRLFRNCVDLLRQLKRAVVLDSVAYNKISNCLEKMNRDIVNAEQYFE